MNRDAFLDRDLIDIFDEGDARSWRRREGLRRRGLVVANFSEKVWRKAVLDGMDHKLCRFRLTARGKKLLARMISGAP